MTKKIINDLFTGIDGETADIARYSWAICIFAIVFLACWNAYRNGVVDLPGFGTAVAAIVGAHGAALWAKRDVEPKAKD